MISDYLKKEKLAKHHQFFEWTRQDTQTDSIITNFNQNMTKNIRISLFLKISVEKLVCIEYLF